MENLESTSKPKTKTIVKTIEKYDKDGNYIGKDVIYEEVPITENESSKPDNMLCS